MVFIAIGEVVFRLTAQEENYYYNKASNDAKLGWRTKANYQSQGTIKTKKGAEYTVDYSTIQKGFRHFDKLDSLKKRLLVVGDSYTQAVEVNSAAMYGRVLADSLDLALYNYGQAGYGTLQQAMLIEEVFDTIQPDLVILQMCSNDFVDNHAPMEYNSNYRVGLRRPYLTMSGEIDYVLPVARWKRIIKKSKFASLILKKFLNATAQADKTTQYQIQELGKEYLPYGQSYQITGQILDRIQSKVGQTPLLALLLVNGKPYEQDLVTLCAERGIPYALEPFKTLLKAQWDGKDVKTSDGYHFTPLGHQIIAEGLIPEVKNLIQE